MITFQIRDKQYELAGNLMVAYQLQKCNNHAPYTKVLSEMGEMTLEKQLEVIYTAFAVANPELAKDYSNEAFRMMVLEDPSMNVTRIMQALKEVSTGILGKDLTDKLVEESEGNG